METTQTHDHMMQEHAHHMHHQPNKSSEVKSFYIFVAIIAFTVIVLQPLAMLTVIFMQAMMQ